MLALSFWTTDMEFKLYIEQLCGLDQYPCVCVCGVWKHDEWHSMEWNTIWPLAQFQCKCLANWVFQHRRRHFSYSTNRHNTIAGLCLRTHFHINDNHFICLYMLNSPFLCIFCTPFNYSCLLKNSLQVLSFASLCGSQICTRKMWTSKLSLAHISCHRSCSAIFASAEPEK